MQITRRDEMVLDWLRTVRMVEMQSLRWVLGGFAGAGTPVSLRKAQQWVARCREVGLVATARPSYQSGSVVWATHQITGKSAPNLMRQTVRHDLAVAAIAARYVCAGWEWDTDREPARGQHQADGIAVRGDTRELVEVELTVKARERYPSIFNAHDMRLRYDGITGIVYFTDTKAARALTTQIQERVFIDDRDRFTIIPAMDVWGRIDENAWPSSSNRWQLGAPSDSLLDAL